MQFSNGKYKEHIVSKLSTENLNTNTLKFVWIFLISIKKNLGGLHSPVFNKELSRAIMTRTRLKSNILNENRRLCSQQWNYCFLFSRKTKREFRGNINKICFTRNKTFWKTVKAFLSESNIYQSKVMHNLKCKINA